MNFLLKCGWPEASLPVLASVRFETWSQFKEAFAKEVNIDFTHDEAEEHRNWHASTQTESVSSPAHGTIPNAIPIS